MSINVSGKEISMQNLQNDVDNQSKHETHGIEEPTIFGQLNRDYPDR